MTKKTPTTEPLFDLNGLAREAIIHGEIARGSAPETALPIAEDLSQRDLSNNPESPYTRAYRKTMRGIGPLSKGSKR